MPRPGRPRALGQPGRTAAGRTHLGEEVVHCSGALPGWPSAARGSQRGGRSGKPSCHRAAPSDSSPRGAPAAIARCPSRLSHLLFAQTQVSTSSVPTTAFVSSCSKFLTSGLSAPERRTAGGTFLPRVGGGRRGSGERAPSLCAPLRALGAGSGTAGHKARRSGSARTSRRGEQSGAAAQPPLARQRQRASRPPQRPASGPAPQGAEPRPSPCRPAPPGPSSQPATDPAPAPPTALCAPWSWEVRGSQSTGWSSRGVHLSTGGGRDSSL